MAFDHQIVTLALNAAHGHQLLTGGTVESHTVGCRLSRRAVASGGGGGEGNGGRALALARSDLLEVHSQVLEHPHGRRSAGTVYPAARMQERSHQVESLDSRHCVLRQIRCRTMAA